MSVQQILDVIERLVRAAGHPDIASVERLGSDSSTVGITYQSGAHAFIRADTSRVSITPAELPEDLGDYKPRVLYVLRLLVDLLNAARPAGWQWRTVAVEGTHLAPSALQVEAGGQRLLLRVTAGGAPGVDTDPASFDGWQIPADIAASL